MSASAGSSGGPLLNKGGVVIGLQSKASFSSVLKGDDENSPSYGNIFTRLDKVDEIFELRKIDSLQLPGESSAEERTNALSNVKVLIIERNKALQKDIEKTLGDLGTNLSFTISIPKDYETWCRIIGYERGPTTLWIHKIQVEVISATKSRLRYFSKKRKPPKNFWEFWKSGTWSPWFDFHTARILTDYKIKPMIDDRVPVLGGEGIYPYLINPNKFKFFKIHPKAGGGFFDYFPQLLESIIGGLVPNSAQEGKPKDYWTISLCE